MDHAAVARRRDADAPLSPRSFLVATAFFLTWQLCATSLGYPRWFRLYVAALAARFAGHPAAQPSTHAARSTTVPVTPLSPPGVLLQPHLFAGLRSSFFCYTVSSRQQAVGVLGISSSPCCRPMRPSSGRTARRAAAVSTPPPGPHRASPTPSCYAVGRPLLNSSLSRRLFSSLGL